MKKTMMATMLAIAVATALVSTDFSSVDGWQIYAGHGTFSDGGFLHGDPYVVVQLGVGGAYEIQGINISVTVGNCNATGWAVYLRVSADQVVVVFQNMTETGNFSRLMTGSNLRFTHILLESTQGTTRFDSLTVVQSAGQDGNPLTDIDAWFYGVQNNMPYFMPAAAMLVVVSIGLMLIFPRHKRR